MITGGGFPAAVLAFLLVGAPGPEWTALGAVGPEVCRSGRGNATQGDHTKVIYELQGGDSDITDQ